jgi:myo-inositol 2-dehydrogenase/D-chiro-inositol 1-dehydrogenase
VLDDTARAGILVQVGFQRRFDAGYRAAHEAVAAGSYALAQLTDVLRFALAGTRADRFREPVALPPSELPADVIALLE